MSFQPLFRQFHEKILLKHLDEYSDLREKRDRILQRLRDNLSLSFTWFNQGSYAMGTGVRPIDRDYDIDIGIEFPLSPREHDPLSVKQRVYDAVVNHTQKVEWRRSCITVYYQEAREVIYHVDLAVMVKDPYFSKTYLALGRHGDSQARRGWQEDDRKTFITDMKDRFSGEDDGQFRRVIRYLKRWKDEHFSPEGRAAPTGLGFTVAAYKWFQPVRNSGYYGGDYDDLSATAALVRSVQQQFTPKWSASRGGYVHQLSLQFPRAPHDDIFGRMTDQQMMEFHQRIVTLSEELEKARRTGSTEPLRRMFGQDFPKE